MHVTRKQLLVLIIATTIGGASWYYFLFPDEPWIKYNFMVRGNEINAIAEYVERQDDFREFSCVADDVWLDKKAAPESIHRDLQSHCRSSRIHMGHKTDEGSFFYLGSRTKWSSDYWIAVVHDPNLDIEPNCPRWRKPGPAEECIVRLSDDWAIHYWNVTFKNEDVREPAEDVVESP